MSPRLVVLISGNGSNLQAIIDAVATGRLSKTHISLVLSNKRNAYGLQRAQSAGIATKYHNLLPYSEQYPSSDASTRHSSKARTAYDADLAKLILQQEPTLIVCAGWMHILSDAFLQPVSNANVPVLNLHPGLPGEYDGAHAIERAYADFQKGAISRTGLMIHYVIREVDRGAPIVTQEVPILAQDSLQDLETRIHDAEHKLIVDGIAKALHES